MMGGSDEVVLEVVFPSNGRIKANSSRESRTFGGILIRLIFYDISLREVAGMVMSGSYLRFSFVYPVGSARKMDLSEGTDMGK